MGEGNQNARIENNQTCPQLPGTILRISIPPGVEINILNLLEILLPSGLCLIIRVPALAQGGNLSTLTDAIKKAGGSIEFI